MPKKKSTKCHRGEEDIGTKVMWDQLDSESEKNHRKPGEI